MLLALLHSYQRSTATYVGAGGLSSAGAALHSLVNPELAAGGAVTGGVAVVAHHFVKAYVAAGGAVTGGVALHKLVNPETGIGGAVTGGAAITTHRITKTYVAAGGIASGGAAVIVHTAVPVIIGRGRVRQRQVLQVQPAVYAWHSVGGLAAGGAAEVEFERGPVHSYIFAAEAKAIACGGAAEIVFDLVPSRVHLFTARAAPITHGGAAAVTTYSRYRHVMRVDRDDLERFAA